MLAVASFERTTTSGALGVVWLGDGREGELSDCAWSKDDAVGAVVLEVAEFLTLRHVVAGLDVGVDDAGGDVTGEHDSRSSWSSGNQPACRRTSTASDRVVMS